MDEDKVQRHFEEWKWLEKEDRHCISGHSLTIKMFLDKQNLGAEALAEIQI